jgi:hypothetical protein
MSDGAAVNLLRAQVERQQGVDPDRKQRRLDEITDMVASAGAKLISEPSEPPPRPWINMANWDNEPIPQQEWAVLNRIPLRQCVLFSGEGAAGKSTVELHRSAAHVLGRDWLGTLPELGPAIHIDAEDEAAVLHRRLAAVIRHYDVKFADLIKGGLHLMSLAGRDAVLATVNRSGKVEPTPLCKSSSRPLATSSRSRSPSHLSPTSSPATKSTAHRCNNSSACSRGWRLSPTARSCWSATRASKASGVTPASRVVPNGTMAPAPATS